MLDARFYINTGKGGVGKTTVSAAMACALAARGQRVLLMQLNVVDRLGAVFARPAIGTDIVEVAPNVWCVNTTPAAAMREYAMMVIRVKALYRAVFENRMVERLLRVLPGLPELTMLGKAYFHEGERNASGRPTWDAVIIDAPATGHGVFLLQIPHVITSALATGPMAAEAKNMRELLHDHRRTMVNLVTLPEEMPVNETIELRDTLARDFDMRLGHVFVNAVLQPRLGDGDAALARTLLNTHGRDDDELGTLLGAAVFREERARLQRGYVERLQQAFDAPVVEIPFYYEPRFDRSVLERIGTHVIEGAGGAA